MNNAPKLAKAGDKMTEKACKRVRGYPVGTEVQPKAEGDRGQWLCIDCGEPFPNNMQAQGHTKSHRLAWRNFETGNLEEA